MTFLNRVALQKEESLSGFLLRTSEAVGYKNLNWVTKIAGCNSFNSSGITHLASYAEEFSHLLVANENDLKASGYLPLDGPSGKLIGFNSQIFSRHLINTKQCRICPGCIKENSIHKQIWDIKLYIACTKHKSELLTSCPSCNSTISWNRKKLCACNCGYDFTNAAKKEVTAATLQLSEKVEVAAATSKGSELNNLYHKVSLVGWTMGLLPKRCLKSITHRNADQAHSFVKAVSKTLYDSWPENWFKELDTYQTRRGKPLNHNRYLDSAFGHLYTYIYDQEFEASYLELRTGFEQYLKIGKDEAEGSQEKSRCPRRRSYTKNYVTIKNAIQLLNINLSVFEWLQSQNFFSLSDDKQGVDLEEVDAARIFLQSLITEKEASQRLGLKQSIVSEMLKEKMLSAQRGPSIDRHENWILSLKDIRDFIESMNVQPLSRLTDKSISFTQAMKLMEEEDQSQIALIQETLNNNLQVYSRRASVQSMRDIRFSEDQLRYRFKIPPSI